MIFFLQFEATPTRQHPETNDVAGTIADCWIDADSLDMAKEKAQELIRADGWIVGDPEYALADDRDSYEADSPHLQYYEQALIDKDVIVYHTYPVTEEPEDASDGA
ncbi:MAG TPA: hypothetical protein VJZ71_15670 [Phycisphaerae bacterium]|nr:hypothetical protein [Phycisphaerae bacterium]